MILFIRWSLLPELTLLTGPDSVIQYTVLSTSHNFHNIFTVLGLFVKACFCESQNGFEDSSDVVGPAVPDISKDRSAFFFRVQQSDAEDEATTVLLNVRNSSPNDMTITHARRLES